MGRWLVLLALLLLATFGAFFPVLRAEFTNWDDPMYVLENPLVRSLDGANLGRIFSTDTTVAGNYHPLTILSFAIEHAIAGEQPWLYHLDNLVLHLVNTALVFLLVLLLFRVPLAALVAAALFALHPQNVESVAWVSERKGLLYVGFFLASLASYVRHLDRTERGEPFPRYLILSLLLFLCSLLSKGTAVPLPVVLLLIDWYRGRRFSSRLLLEKIPFFLLSFVFGFLALHAQESADAIKTGGYSLLFSFSAANVALLTYLGRFVAPIHQACFHPYPELTGTFEKIAFYGSPALVLLIAVLLFLSLRRTRLLMFGAAFFLLTVALVLQLLPVGNAITADRYTYLPYVGLFSVIACGAAAWVRRWPALSRPALVLFLLVLAALDTLTFQRCQVWRTTEALWTDVIARQPGSAIAFNSRGVARLAKGDFNLALQDFDQAIRINPAFLDPYNNRGAVRMALQQYEQAFLDFDLCVRKNAGFFAAYLNRGQAEHHLGRHEAAVRDLTVAIERRSGDGSAYNYRARSFAELGRYAQALADARRAETLDVEGSRQLVLDLEELLRDPAGGHFPR
ncbi:MAG: tetratricopeptide repeat protein [Planctomycetota bacterium]